MKQYPKALTERSLKALGETWRQTLRTKVIEEYACQELKKELYLTLRDNLVRSSGKNKSIGMGR